MSMTSVKIILRTTIFILFVALVSGCSNDNSDMDKSQKILFLHHSTGKCIWRGGISKYADKLGLKGAVEKWFNKYNRHNNTNYIIGEKEFPTKTEYGWKNYPYDYYNIWVKNAGNELYMSEPTLELLTKEYDLIIFKHCYPVGKLIESSSPASIDSEEKTIENYKLQYNAIKEKLHEFPETKFLLWTGAAMVKNKTNEKAARQTREFFSWIINEWDEQGDNIFLWDFYELETEGGIYLKDKYAVNNNNSHPNDKFSKVVAPYFCQRIVDVLEGRGDSGSLIGK